jgi:hypothetical protein
MKYFSDYQSLKEYISAICSETHVSPTHVEVVTQQLIEQLGFTKDIASAFAKAVLVYHNANSADCVASNALKLSGHWLGMDQATTLTYNESTSYKWYFRSDLTFEYRTEYYRGYSSPFGSRSTSNSSDGFAGLWAPSDVPGNKFEVVTIDTSKNEVRKNSVQWLDQKSEMPRSCQINGRTFARQ